MARFNKGQAVVCVHAGRIIPGKRHDIPLKEGMIYIIREAGVPNHLAPLLAPLMTEPCVRLEGIYRRNDMGYIESRFAPLAEEVLSEIKEVQCPSSHS